LNSLRNVNACEQFTIEAAGSKFYNKPMAFNVPVSGIAWVLAFSETTTR